MLHNDLSTAMSRTQSMQVLKGNGAFHVPEYRPVIRPTVCRNPSVAEDPSVPHNALSEKPS